LSLLSWIVLHLTYDKSFCRENSWAQNVLKKTAELLYAVLNMLTVSDRKVLS